MKIKIRKFRLWWEALWLEFGSNLNILTVPNKCIVIMLLLLLPVVWNKLLFLFSTVSAAAAAATCSLKQIAFSVFHSFCCCCCRCQYCCGLPCFYGAFYQTNFWITFFFPPHLNMVEIKEKKSVFPVLFFFFLFM